jgi:hypothetical protein
MKGNLNKTKNDYPIILKSGATDLGRQEKTLIELVKQNYRNGIHSNTLYAFSNKGNNSIKIIYTPALHITGLFTLAAPSRRLGFRFC